MADPPSYLHYAPLSYRYATSKIAELQHLFPDLEHSQPKGRSQCFYFILFMHCRTIVERTDKLRAMFRRIEKGIEGNAAILRQWEIECLEKFEVDGSIGWNYLCQHNFETLMQELEKIYRIRDEIIEMHRGKPRVKIVFSMTVPRLRPEFKLHTNRRREVLQQVLNRIKEEAKRGSHEREAFFTAWTWDVEYILERKFKRDTTWLQDLEKWARIEAGLANVEKDPEFANKPNGSSSSHRWAVLKGSVMREVVGAMMAVPRPLSPPPGYVPPPDYVPPRGHDTLPPYTDLALAHHRRISLRQAKLRQDVPTFGFAQGGGFLI
ncbi:hypothetical protein JCM5353_001657 [Sporobolomyces roseus]